MSRTSSCDNFPSPLPSEGDWRGTNYTSNKLLLVLLDSAGAQYSEVTVKPVVTTLRVASQCHHSGQ